MQETNHFTYTSICFMAMINLLEADISDDEFSLGQITWQKLAIYSIHLL